MKNSHRSTVNPNRIRRTIQLIIHKFPGTTSRQNRRKTLSLVIDLIGEGLSISNLSLITHLTWYLLVNGATRENSEHFLKLVIRKKWKLKESVRKHPKYSLNLISTLKKLFRFVKK